MADLSKIEQQNTRPLLRERNIALVGLKGELSAILETLREVRKLKKQNQFFEREVDVAHGRILMLMDEKLRSAEVAHSDEFLRQMNDAFEALKVKLTKKAAQD